MLALRLQDAALGRSKQNVVLRIEQVRHDDPPGRRNSQFGRNASIRARNSAVIAVDLDMLHHNRRHQTADQAHVQFH